MAFGMQHQTKNGKWFEISELKPFVILDVVVATVHDGFTLRRNYVDLAGKNVNVYVQHDNVPRSQEFYKEPLGHDESEIRSGWNRNTGEFFISFHGRGYHYYDTHGNPGGNTFTIIAEFY